MTVVGHGIDLIEIARIQRSVETHGQRFLDRIYTPTEQAHGRHSKRRFEHLAARFAAKEAAAKALGTGVSGGINWTDFAIETAASGAPALVLYGQAERLAADLGVSRQLVSLSHSGGFAVASVILVGG